jgi:hypothetical protein
MTTITRSIEKNLTQIYELHSAVVVRPFAMALVKEEHKAAMPHQSNGHSFSGEDDDVCNDQYRQSKNAAYYVL